MSEAPEPTGGQNPLWSVVTGLRGIAENVVKAAGTATSPLSELPGLPEVATHPGAMSAAQLGAMRSAIQAQRDAVAAMQSQLAAFDEQLEVLQRLLVPLAEWSATWARLESRVVPGGRPAKDADTDHGEA
ncbi:hypothetical protein ACFPK1_04785 [Actinomycetospora rhizophila]|uniref:Uncharacterized protein n=1 Tax=Actinomycetospora rhizophila TaxID=1416876 RepID=A0ABV9ZBG9_9PSEU